MIIFEIIQYAMAGLLGLLLAYQVLLSVLALFGRKKKNFECERKRKFAVVIPAHNEEEDIAKTIYSLSGLVYPKNLYDLIVIADNCSDNTAAIAEKLGSKVLVRENYMDRGKGFALRWAFNQILADDTYEGVVIIDSDSLVGGNYLDVMNYYLEKGHSVVQSSDLVLPQPGAWSSESTRLGFLLYNYVKPLGRKVLGFPIGLRGNGMCFLPEILREMPWNAWSQIEDVEYGLSLMLEGVDITFAPEATVWAKMPAKAKNAESQRQRWEMGRYPVIRKYMPKLLMKAIRTRSPKYIDALLDLVSPPLVNSLLLIIAMITTNYILVTESMIDFYFLWIWVGLAGLGFMHLFTGLIAARADASVYKSILYIPLYSLWKIKVYVGTLFKGREKEWVRTTRES